MDGLDRDEVVWRKREQVRRGRRAENVEGRVEKTHLHHYCILLLILLLIFHPYPFLRPPDTLLRAQGMGGPIAQARLNLFSIKHYYYSQWPNVLSTSIE